MPDLTPSIRNALRSSTLLALVLGFGLSVAPVYQAQAFGAPESFAELADKISPAVVNITTSSLVAAPAGGGPVAPEGSPFGDFFGLSKAHPVFRVFFPYFHRGLVQDLNTERFCQASQFPGQGLGLRFIHRSISDSN